MISLRLILMIIGLVCLLLAGLNVSAPRVNLGWLGLALWLLAVMMA
jgi:hypothetical protein